MEQLEIFEVDHFIYIVLETGKKLLQGTNFTTLLERFTENTMPF